MEELLISHPAETHGNKSATVRPERREEACDRDRLDAAFAELEANGIVARQDYGCCTNCGAKLMHEEIADLWQKGRQVRGYVFYHRQDTESARQSGGVFLAFDAVTPTVKMALAIGQEIVATLVRHGLTVRWSGDLQFRIFAGVSWVREPNASNSETSFLE